MRVLLVEDDELLGEGLQAGLRRAGCAVEWVQDGVAADAALGAEPFSVVVLDLGLPRLGGLDLLARLRARNDRTPVLVLTARQPVELAPREFALLHELLLNVGRVLTRQQLESRLYEWDQGLESNAIEVHVHHLRRKLGANLISTVRGVGYMIPRDGVVRG